MGLMWHCQSAMTASESRGRARQWPTSHRPWPPRGGHTPVLARLVWPAGGDKRGEAAMLTHSRSLSASPCIVAFSLAVAAVVTGAPPCSRLTVVRPFHRTTCLHLFWSSTMLESRCLGWI